MTARASSEMPSAPCRRRPEGRRPVRGRPCRLNAVAAPRARLKGWQRGGSPQPAAGSRLPALPPSRQRCTNPQQARTACFCKAAGSCPSEDMRRARPAPNPAMPPPFPPAWQAGRVDEIRQQGEPDGASPAAQAGGPAPDPGGAAAGQDGGPHAAVHVTVCGAPTPAARAPPGSAPAGTSTRNFAVASSALRGTAASSSSAAQPRMPAMTLVALAGIAPEPAASVHAAARIVTVSAGGVPAFSISCPWRPTARLRGRRRTRSAAAAAATAAAAAAAAARGRCRTGGRAAGRRPDAQHQRESPRAQGRPRGPRPGGGAQEGAVRRRQEQEKGIGGHLNAWRGPQPALRIALTARRRPGPRGPAPMHGRPAGARRCHVKSTGFPRAGPRIRTRPKVEPACSLAVVP